jgi:hypothetical protein
VKDLISVQYRYPEVDGGQAGNPDAGRLDGQDLVDGPILEQFIEFLPQLADEGDIDLVVQEAVHLQHVAAFDSPVRQDLFLQ